MLEILLHLFYTLALITTGTYCHQHWFSDIPLMFNSLRAGLFISHSLSHHIDHFSMSEREKLPPCRKHIQFIKEFRTEC